MNFTFSFMSPPVYLHFAGVSSDEVTYVHRYEMEQMPYEEFQEFKRLLNDLANVPGLSVLYEPEHFRWRISYGVPSITTMDNNGVEYE